MSTYTQLTREDFEDWIRSLGFRNGQWEIKPGTGGIYWLFLSPTVAISINSTTGTQSQVRSRGKASMSLKLVSRITGRTLNKKAQGQSHFARTINWRKNWAKGVNRMRETYDRAKGFYDSIARIENREEYVADWIEKIEAVPSWNNNDFIVSMYDRLSGGRVLTERQEAALEAALQRLAPQEQEEEQAPAGASEEFLEALREIYRRARNQNDQRTVRFIGSVGQQARDRDLSDNQMRIVERIADDYMVTLPA